MEQSIIRGSLVDIFICHEAGQPMQLVQSVRTIVGHGLQNDRYSTGNGSFNKGESGKRQVSLISEESFEGTGIYPIQSRRNLIIRGIELPRLIRQHFTIGNIHFRGLEYCCICNGPSNAMSKNGFLKWFRERGGILAEVWGEGEIKGGDEVVRIDPP
jgi:hypothetical protein